MRVAMLAPSGSVHTMRWSRGLADRGHEILLVSNSASTASPQGITTRFLPGRGAFAYFLNIRSARKILWEFGPEIVHAHYATGYGLWGSMQNTAPLVLSVWGTDIADAARNPWRVGKIVRRTLRSARYITATSRFLLESTVSFAPDVMDKIEVVPFGVSLPEESMHKEYNDDKGPITIVFAKAYLPNYGPDIVLEAFARAYRESKQLRLVMMGGGKMHRQLQRMAESLKIAAVVTIDGRVEPEEAGRKVGQGDIFVMPSYSESFGVAAVEAASYGLPVIASNIGGIPEVVEDGITGLLIPPGDEEKLAQAILRLAGDSECRRSMGEAGRRMVSEKYDIERCLDKMETVYRKALAG